MYLLIQITAERLRYFLEDTSVPVSASTHHAVISLSKRKMHMGMNLQVFLQSIL